MKKNNVINLSDYRKGKEKETLKTRPGHHKYIQDFEVGGYYIYPELGVMIHCMLITDSSHTHNNKIMYILEDQFGNIFSVPIDDPDSMMGWRPLEKEVFTEIVKKGLPEPEPPRVG